jgi:uncharacterized protein DUF397
MTRGTTDWIKASGGGSDGPYVEMRRNGDRIEVRNSGDGGQGPVLSFTLPEFEAWLDGAQHGEFDHLAPETGGPVGS